MADAQPARHNEGESPLVIRLGPEVFKYGTSSEFREAAFAHKLLPVGVLRGTLLAKLKRLHDPDIYRGAPATTSASAVLIDGTSLPRVRFIPEWLVLQHMVPFWYHYVKTDSVDDIAPSPNRIPLPYRRQLNEVGQNWYDALEFMLVMYDDKRLPCVFTAADDLVVLPAPYTPADIVGIEIAKGATSGEQGILREADFIWCPYRE